MTDEPTRSPSIESFGWENPARGDEPPAPHDATAPGANEALRAYALWLARGTTNSASDPVRALQHDLWRLNYGKGDTGFDGDLIAEVAAEAHAIADKERHAALRRDAIKEANFQAARFERTDAGMVKKIAATFDVSERRAYYILRTKTPDPSRARTLANLFPWTTFEDWYRPKEKPGPKLTLAEWWNRDALGYRFSDFALTDGGIMAKPVTELFIAISEAYRRGEPIPHHFGDFQAFRLATFRLADEKTAIALWAAYSRWRIESLATDGLCDVELSTPYT